MYQSDGIIEDCQILNNNNSGVADCDGPIRRCLIYSNGGGLSQCDGTIFDSRIERTRGAGISGGSVEITRYVVATNSAFGIFNHSGRISQSLIVGNGSFGIYGGDGGLVENCVVAGNSDSGFYSSNKSVLSSTITGNHGYGFHSHAGTVRHVILWDNLSGPLWGSTTPLFSGTANPYFVRPGFWDLVNNVWIDGDYHLSPNSPYIDAGDPAYSANPSNPTEDIDGNPRIVGVRVDIGAYEFQAACEGDDFDGDETPDVCDRDIDGDGIPNVPDLCDFTPPGVPVDDQGRPRADLNLDCIVDLRDFADFQNSLFGP